MIVLPLLQKWAKMWSVGPNKPLFCEDGHFNMWAYGGRLELCVTELLTWLLTFRATGAVSYSLQMQQKQKPPLSCYFTIKL